MLRPSKIKNINKPLLNGGVNGEKMMISGGGAGNMNYRSSQNNSGQNENVHVYNSEINGS